ncbi:MAG: P1 family peptidase [Dehalococcoidia bacterium]|nr:P1 family peptidase [Dehalococcoidia bacterium]
MNCSSLCSLSAKPPECTGGQGKEIRPVRPCAPCADVVAIGLQCPTGRETRPLLSSARVGSARLTAIDELERRLAGGDGWTPGRRDAITDVRGIRVGHWTDRTGATGCTVILCESCEAAAADVRGGAPGTREIDVLSPANVVRRCHAVVLTGGSAMGLAAASGVVRWCREQGVGFETPAGPVPIVTAAVLFDLTVGRAGSFPDEQAGYAAAARARAGAVAQGSVGAGTGATVGKLLGPEARMKGGLGTASLLGPRGVVVGALVAVNAVGEVSDPDTALVVAGPREAGGGFVPLAETIARRPTRESVLGANTTLVCVATNARLPHAVLQRVAYQAHDGIARTIAPAHTLADGDATFVLGMGQLDVPPDDALTVGALAVRAVEVAILRGVLRARGSRWAPAARGWAASS